MYIIYLMNIYNGFKGKKRVLKAVAHFLKDLSGVDLGVCRVEEI